MITLRYTDSLPRALAARAEVRRRTRPGLVLIPWVGWFMVGLPILSWLGSLWVGEDPAPPPISLFLFGAGIVCAAAPLLNRLEAILTFQRSKFANSEVRVEIDASEIRSSQLGLESKIPWKHVTRVAETRRGFVVFLSPSVAFFLPKDAFPDPEAIATFRGYAALPAAR